MKTTSYKKINLEFKGKIYHSLCFSKETNIKEIRSFLESIVGIISGYTAYVFRNNNYEAVGEDYIPNDKDTIWFRNIT